MTHVRRMFNHPARLLAAAAAALVAAACSDSTSNNTSQPEVSAAISQYTAQKFAATAKPMFTTDGGATPFRTSRTIPYWSSSFTYSGVTYPFTMVGTNAFTSNAQTTVPAVIIPFRFVFANGIVMDGGADVAATIASPIFADFTYPLSANDHTQYGDAIQRAMFNRLGSTYHVLLDDPTVAPTQTIEVPASKGVAFPLLNGSNAGLMDIGWFANKLHKAINALHVPPQTFPIVLTDNTFLFRGDQCCVLGFHGALSSVNGNGNQPVQTYMYAAFITPNTFGGPGSDGLSDIHAISHEVSEWVADPFVNNVVPPWTAPGYDCNSFLETGDPVVGVWFPLPGNPQPGANNLYHPEDEVYLSWFARQVPSIAYNQLYTYMGTFSGPSTGC
jgi:hypothetical protein